MMWTHVSDAALMDVVEGAAGERAEKHVAQCAGCRARVDEARAALGFAAAAAVPEPIPAYWDVMRRRVAHALGEAPAARSRRPLWAAAAVAGAAVIAFLTVGPAKDPAPRHVRPKQYLRPPRRRLRPGLARARSWRR
jgi:hypothetical protein